MIKRIRFVAVFAGLVILPAITMSQKTGVDPAAGKTAKERQSTETPNSSNTPGSLQISSVIAETVPEIKGAPESKGDPG